MANSTRANLRSDLRVELKKDPNAKIWSDASLNAYLKQAYLKLQKDGNFQWRENQANTTFSTVVGTQEYTLPTNLGKIELIRYEQDDLIKDTKVGLKRRYNNFVSGKPSRYYLFGANIGFDTLPDAVGTVDIDYLANLAFVTDDTTEIDYGIDFDTAIVKYAAFLAWSSIDGKQSTAAGQLQEYQLEIDTLYSSYIFDNMEDLTFHLQRSSRGNITRSTVLDR